MRESLERLACRLGITGRVRFLGWRRDLTTIYGATDVCVLTSRNEGTPVAVIARRTHLAAGTVRNHLAACVQKLGATDRAEAVRRAREAGWL